jgi:hypothetical protein
MKLFPYDKHIRAGDVVAVVRHRLEDDRLPTIIPLLGPSEIHTFSPESPHVRVLLTDYGADHYHPFALGAGAGFARLQDGCLTGTLNGCGVEIKPLDSLAADWPRLDFVRISVNGFEPFVIAGARATLLRLRPKLFVRVTIADLVRYGQTPHALISLIMSLGYATIPHPLKAKIADASYDLLCVPTAQPVTHAPPTP